MSNSYFKIQKEIATPGFGNHSGYRNKYELTLTAFVGDDQSGNVQMTIQTQSTIDSQSGVSYITLNSEEIDKLIFGLLERKLRLVSATGSEQSLICPSND